MTNRVLSGEDRRVRRKRHGRVGERGLKKDAFPRQSVQVRRQAVSATVDAKDIGPQGIDSDQEQVVTVKQAFRNALRGVRRRSVGAPQQEARCQDHRNHGPGDELLPVSSGVVVPLLLLPAHGSGSELFQKLLHLRLVGF